MRLSLAFLSPALAEAAMEGRLPRGFCVKRLTDLPGDLDTAILRRLREHRDASFESARPFAARGPTTREGVGLKSGALLVREWNGRLEGAVTLPREERERSTPYGILSRRDGLTPRGHRRGA